MSWKRHHTASETLASAAEAAVRRHQLKLAQSLYESAAEAELQALRSLDPSKKRTLGITVVSAAALFYKAGNYNRAMEVFEQWNKNSALPRFAIRGLQEIRGSILPKSPVAQVDYGFTWVSLFSSLLLNRAGEIFGATLIFVFTYFALGQGIDFIFSNILRTVVLLSLCTSAIVSIVIRDHLKAFVFVAGPCIFIFFTFLYWASYTTEIRNTLQTSKIPDSTLVGNFLVGGTYLDILVLLIVLLVFGFSLIQLRRDLLQKLKRSQFTP